MRVSGASDKVFSWWVPCSERVVLIIGIGDVNGVLVIIEKEWGVGEEEGGV